MSTSIPSIYANFKYLKLQSSSQSSASINPCFIFFLCSAIPMAGKTSMLICILVFLLSDTVAFALNLTILNQCNYSVWPVIISGNDDTIGDGGVNTLAPGQSIHLTAGRGWSGRFWARTGCDFDASGKGKCLTGDCFSRNCVRAGEPPFTLAELTIALETTDNDFYHVSVIEGYNVGIGVNATGGTGDCQYAGCVDDLNGHCPPELQVNVSGSVIACKSACEAFKAAEFCCSDDYSTPETCSPTEYSQSFNKSCPFAYTYAYDAASKTHTCSGSDYLITFCPTKS